MSRSATKVYELTEMDGDQSAGPMPCDTLRRGRAILTADVVGDPLVGSLLVQVSNQPATDQSRRQDYTPPEDTFVTTETVAVSLADPGQSVDSGVFDLTCTYVRFAYTRTSGDGTATLRVVLTGDEE